MGSKNERIPYILSRELVTSDLPLSERLLVATSVQILVDLEPKEVSEHRKHEVFAS